ncbi:MAG: hypothetical protein RJQ00_11950 [Vicingaceae bacterium]
MKQKTIYLFSIIIIASLFACSSGKKAFEKGNYDEGLFKAINRLRQSPNNKRAKETLRFGYPITLEWHEDNIERFKISKDEFMHEQIYYEYKQINTIANEIKRCPACLRIIRNPKYYVAEQTAAAEKAAEVRYVMGEDLLSQSYQQNDKTRAMDAYYHFEKANQMIPGFKQSIDKMQEARWQATTKVVIEPISTGSAMLDISSDFFYNKIQDYMQQLQVSPFVQFYTPKEAVALNINQPDQQIVLKFDHFVVGQVYHKVSEEIRSRDSVIIATVEDSNDSLIDVYGTVNAKLTINTKELSSRGLLDLKIIDPYTSRVLTQEKLPGEYIWITQWGNFNGNEKALYTEDWNIINSVEAYPPSPQDLFVAFTQPIFNQVTAKLNNFYSTYR